MITSEIQATTTSSPASASKPAGDDHGFSFHDFLSAINPLQYLPVVGTIYRAVTGDVIPEALRRVGSFVVSGLLGGPVGLIINAATTLAEKITDIDPEEIVGSVLHGTQAADVAGSSAVAAKAVGSDPVGVWAGTQEPAAAATGSLQVGPSPVTPDQVALTQKQLAAYGVRTGPSGNLQLGDLEGADVLNSIQLSRLGKTAAAAYAANQGPVPAAVAAPAG